MGRPSRRLLRVLRDTAARLQRQDVPYRWSSFGQCNCGHLAQTVTGLDAQALQARGLQGEGDWAAQARAAERSPRFFPDFGDRPALDEGAWEPEDVGACPVTGITLQDVLSEMNALGLTAQDVAHLERLSDPVIRRRLGNHTTSFAHYDRANVVAYLRAWADLVEEQLASLSSPEIVVAA